MDELTVICLCGTRMRAPAHAVGKTVKCVSCGEKFKINPPSASESDTTPQRANDEAEVAVDSTPSLRHSNYFDASAGPASFQPTSINTATAKPWRKKWVLAAAIVVILAIVAGVLVFGLGRTAPPVESVEKPSAQYVGPIEYLKYRYEMLPDDYREKELPKILRVADKVFQVTFTVFALVVGLYFGLRSVEGLPHNTRGKNILALTIVALILQLPLQGLPLILGHGLGTLFGSVMSILIVQHLYDLTVKEGLIVFVWIITTWIVLFMLAAWIAAVVFEWAGLESILTREAT